MIVIQKTRKKIGSILLGGVILFTPGALVAQAAPNMEAILNSIISTYPAATMDTSVLSSQASIDTLTQSYTSSAITTAVYQSGLQALVNSNSLQVAGDMQTWLDGYKASLDTTFSTNFLDFGKGLSQYYGDAMLFTHHLSNPIGYDHLGEGPVYTFGGGLGLGFSNVADLNSNTTGDASTIFNSVKLLPAAAIGINAGMSLSPEIDIRVSIFPKNNINLPVPAYAADKYNVIFSYAAYKGKFNYNVLRGDSMNLGLSLGAFFSYTEGKIEVNTKDVAQVPRSFTGTSTTVDTTLNYNVVTTPSYNIRTQSIWDFYTFGPELKVWYNFDFLIPYIGYALSFQFGNF